MARFISTITSSGARLWATFNSATASSTCPMDSNTPPTAACPVETCGASLTARRKSASASGRLPALAAVTPALIADVAAARSAELRCAAPRGLTTQRTSSRAAQGTARAISVCCLRFTKEGRIRSPKPAITPPLPDQRRVEPEPLMVTKVTSSSFSSFSAFSWPSSQSLFRLPLLIGRRTVKSGNRDVIEPEIDA